MASHLIGRIKEQAILNQCYASDKAELVAVYGRRRVGKTFLVKTLFKDQITLHKLIIEFTYFHLITHL